MTWYSKILIALSTALLFPSCVTKLTIASPNGTSTSYFSTGNAGYVSLPGGYGINDQNNSASQRIVAENIRKIANTAEIVGGAVQGIGTLGGVLSDGFRKDVDLEGIKAQTQQAKDAAEASSEIADINAGLEAMRIEEEAAAAALEAFNQSE